MIKRTIIFASHHTMAEGLVDTVKFLTHTNITIKAFCAYLDNKKIDQAVKDLMAQFTASEEVFILADLPSGSVSQVFYQYTKLAHVHLISGINLPLAMDLCLEPTDHYYNDQEIEQIVQAARNSLVYLNDQKAVMDDEDE
ncbi:MAG: PTS sugar transporter subunit IIA [Bombilactobacillus sp.]